MNHHHFNWYHKYVPLQGYFFDNMVNIRDTIPRCETISKTIKRINKDRISKLHGMMIPDKKNNSNNNPALPNQPVDCIITIKIQNNESFASQIGFGCVYK